jgi:hypothetical protein
MFDCREHHEVEELLLRSENHLERTLCSVLAAERFHAPDMSVIHPRASELCSRTDFGHGSNWSARVD